MEFKAYVKFQGCNLIINANFETKGGTVSDETVGRKYVSFFVFAQTPHVCILFIKKPCIFSKFLRGNNVYFSKCCIEIWYVNV